MAAAIPAGAYFLNFPSKFISKDGRTLWLCYSANFSPGWNGVELKFNPPGGRYGLCLHEVRLLQPGEKPEETPNPLTGPENVARQAKVQASSTHPDYRAAGATDGRAGGYPDNIAEEWATQGESKGAWIKLTWDQPQRVDRIWLVDRPNLLDQVTAGTLKFSDGSTIALEKLLPDSGEQAVEIAFPAKTVSWVKFTVTGVKPKSPNIGLSEIAVFHAGF